MLRNRPGDLSLLRRLALPTQEYTGQWKRLPIDTPTALAGAHDVGPAGAGCRREQARSAFASFRGDRAGESGPLGPSSVSIFGAGFWLVGSTDYHVTLQPHFLLRAAGLRDISEIDNIGWQACSLVAPDLIGG